MQARRRNPEGNGKSQSHRGEGGAEDRRLGGDGRGDFLRVEDSVEKPGEERIEHRHAAYRSGETEKVQTQCGSGATRANSSDGADNRAPYWMYGRNHWLDTGVCGHKRRRLARKDASGERKQIDYRYKGGDSKSENHVQPVFGSWISGFDVVAHVKWLVASG